MKTKLEMAHDYAVAMLKTPAQLTGLSDKDIAIAAFNLADAMQAEADKRKPSGLPESLREHHDFTEAIAKGVENYEKEEWQPDWSKKTNEELRMLVKTLDGIIESRSDCSHEWDHISAYGGSGNYYVCPCGAEKHPVDDF